MQQVDELERLKSDLKLEEGPQAGAPPAVPTATRPSGASLMPAGKTAKVLFEYEVRRNFAVF